MAKRRKYMTGVDQVERIFRALPRELQEDWAVALNQGGAEMAAGARLLAPRDESSADPEHIADDIGHRLVVNEERRTVSAVVYAGTRPETKQAALRSEFGRQPGGDGMEGHPGHGKQEFFFVAGQALRKRSRGRLQRVTNKAIKRVAKRFGRNGR